MKLIASYKKISSEFTVSILRAHKVCYLDLKLSLASNVSSKGKLTVAANNFHLLKMLDNLKNLGIAFNESGYFFESELETRKL